MRELTVKLIALLQRGYKVSVSPLIGDVCRFEPSCSDYFVEAVREMGVLKGTCLGVRRICRCHPLNPGGYDPVPQRPVDRKVSSS